MPRTMDWNADSIRQLRGRAQMSQSQLARWLGVTIKQVKHLENRRRNPSGPVEQLLNILATRSGRTPEPFQVVSTAQLKLTADDHEPVLAAEEAFVWD